MIFKLRALTPIYTGGLRRDDNSELRFTGIKGSIRWWYEVLIRGLGFYACDPRPDADGCSFDIKNVPQAAINDARLFTREVKEQICPACYLFGCTGWSGKFIIRIATDGRTPRHHQILNHETPFRIHFISLKQLEPIEEILIEKTVKLIVDYGAIGGKTVLKPSEFDHKNINGYRNARDAHGHHLDYGVLGREKINSHDESGLSGEVLQQEENRKWRGSAGAYLLDFIKNTNKDEWPDLQYFWFIPGYTISRDQHDTIIKGYGSIPNWLGGKQRISKKIFSFHGINKTSRIQLGRSASAGDIIPGVKRSYGYTKRDDAEFRRVKDLIADVCSGATIKDGSEVLNEL